MMRCEVACPTCGAQPGKRCVATTTGRGNTDTHKARTIADNKAWREREAP